MNHHLSLTIAACLHVCGSAAPVPARGDDVPVPSERGGGGGDESKWSLTLRGAPSVTFESDLSDDAGRVSVWRTEMGVELSGPVGDRLRLTWGVRGDVARYRFEDFTILGGEEPLDNAYEAGTSLLGVLKLDDQWSLIARGSVTSGWAEDGEAGDGFWGTAALGVGYRFSDRFSLALGGGIITRLEDDPAFLPLVIINWKVSDRVTLSTTGVGLKLTGEVSDQLEVFMRAGGEFHQYRLDDDHPALPGGVLRDTRVPVGVGVDWRPIAGLTLSIEGGAVVYQQYELRTDSGDRFDRVETDPAAYIGASVAYRF